MRNPLTFRIESSLGAFFVILFSMFFLSLIFTVVKNFESDMDIMSATNTHIKIARVSEAELILIRDWIAKKKIDIPESGSYRSLLKQYPDRPWFNE